VSGQSGSIVHGAGRYRQSQGQCGSGLTAPTWVETAALHVFSHNEKAIGLYKRLGFSAAESLPLRRIEEEDMVKYSVVDRPEANAGFDYLRMEFPIERFRQAHSAALLTG
jgi:ribosomal protein S18 acetylase RimI-like enzyme